MKQFVKKFASIYISDDEIQDQINNYLSKHKNFSINQIINLNLKNGLGVLVVFDIKDE